MGGTGTRVFFTIIFRVVLFGCCVVLGQDPLCGAGADTALACSPALTWSLAHQQASLLFHPHSVSMNFAQTYTLACGDLHMVYLCPGVLQGSQLGPLP